MFCQYLSYTSLNCSKLFKNVSIINTYYLKFFNNILPAIIPFINTTHVANLNYICLMLTLILVRVANIAEVGFGMNFHNTWKLTVLLLFSKLILNTTCSIDEIMCIRLNLLLVIMCYLFSLIFIHLVLVYCSLILVYLIYFNAVMLLNSIQILLLTVDKVCIFMCAHFTNFLIVRFKVHFLFHALLYSSLSSCLLYNVNSYV